MKEKIIKILEKYDIDEYHWKLEIADEILKMAEFEALCNPDIYEAHMNEHFEAEIAKDAKVIFKEPEHDEQTAEKLRQALDLASQKSGKKKPEGMTAEEILKPYADLAENIALTPGIYVVELSDAVKAMKAYAHAKQPGLRDKLYKAFIAGRDINLYFDEYLKTI